MYDRGTFVMFDVMSRRTFVGSALGIGLAAGVCSNFEGVAYADHLTQGRVDVGSLAADVALALPSDVVGLPTIMAQPFAEIAPGSQTDALEGLVFDREGMMYVCHRFREKADGGDVTSSEICRIDEDGVVERLIYNKNASFNGIAIHRDGHFFVADMSGHIWLYPAEGAGEPLDELPLDTPDAASRILPNDLVFDANTGDLYFANFNASMLNPTDGVCRASAESGYREINEVIGDLVTPNGITFDPACSNLYVSETGLNRIIKVSLKDGAANPGFLGCCVVYQGQGTHGPDSSRLDASGNFYQAFYPAGRAVIFNADMVAVANVVPFDCADHAGWKTSSLALHPTKPEGYLISGGERGMWVLKFDALAASAPPWHLV